MSCTNCTQAAIEKEVTNKKVYEAAQSLATEIKEWVGVYTDPSDGTKKFAAVSSGSYPWESFYTPKLQESDL